MVVNGTVISLPSGVRYSIRVGVAADVREVTELIHRAFAVWKKEGISLGPMYQTEEETAAHLVGKGYVAQTLDGRIAGTISVDEGKLVKRTGGPIKLISNSEAITYAPVNDDALPVGRMLIPRKLAVDPMDAGSGLGNGLFMLVEGLACSDSFAGIALETVREASWLYDWYTRLGYWPVGTHRFPGRQVDTVLMIKAL